MLQGPLSVLVKHDKRRRGKHGTVVTFTSTSEVSAAELPALPPPHDSFPMTVSLNTQTSKRLAHPLLILHCFWVTRNLRVWTCNDLNYLQASLTSCTVFALGGTDKTEETTVKSRSEDWGGGGAGLWRLHDWLKPFILQLTGELQMRLSLRRNTNLRLYFRRHTPQQNIFPLPKPCPTFHRLECIFQANGSCRFTLKSFRTSRRLLLWSSYRKC